MNRLAQLFLQVFFGRSTLTQKSKQIPEILAPYGAMKFRSLATKVGKAP